MESYTCEHCHREALRVWPVLVARQTHSSPAEYEMRCARCVAGDEADDPHERAAARARNNDFEDTDGRDWT